MIGMMPAQVTPVRVGEMKQRMMIVKMMNRPDRTNIEKFVPSTSCTTCTSEFSRETIKITQRVVSLVVSYKTLLTEFTSSSFVEEGDILGQDLVKVVFAQISGNPLAHNAENRGTHASAEPRDLFDREK